MAGCVQPEYVSPTADRQGLTSLTAIFTYGPYENQELAKLQITDPEQDYFEIPIPFYYPESSDNQTLSYMTSLRVQAELQPNFKISPSLTILDLTEDNVFTLTDPFGATRQITITGKRVKSSACEITSFALVDPAVSGIINKETREIVLPTKDDLSACKASVQISAHASISPDPKKERNYNSPVKFTVTSDNGTQAVFTVVTGDPEKIESGLNIETTEKLFNFDPVSRLGLPAYSETVCVSLGVLEGDLVVSLGNLSAPVILNGLTGDKKGTLNVGSASVASITNDEGGNLLLFGLAKGGDERETMKVWKMTSQKGAPEEFFGFENPVDCPIGHKVKVIGDVASDAVIVFTAEGIDGITGTGKVVVVPVETGAALEPVVYDFYESLGFSWGGAPVNTATVVPASLDYSRDGFYLDYYEGGSQQLDMLHWISGKGTDTPIIAYGGDNAWGLNANCLDSKQFNGCAYMAVFVVSHFPQWGLSPRLYFYEITDPSSCSLLVSNEEVSWYQKGDSGIAGGDVVLAPSSDGFYLFIYYYDHNSQVVGGYRVDCIKR